jgi:inosine-uridine nucleoside N-ribohydrolase
MTKKIIIDCDPGHDDAIELLLALADPEVNLLGICTVAGNQTIEKTTTNALKVLQLADRNDIKVYKGAAKPLIGDLITAPNIHGISGLDGTLIEEPTQKYQDKGALDFLHHALINEEHVTIVSTGPITNLGLLLLVYPEVKKNIDRIVWMGGSYSMGNITPEAEFNAYNDPEALDIILKQDLDFTMVTLDVTHRVLFSLKDIERIKNMHNKISFPISELLEFFYSMYEKNFSLGGVPIHDACALAEAIHPGIVRTGRFNVSVNTLYGISRGRTVVDLYNVTGKPHNARVSIDINVNAFRNYLFDMLNSY